MPHLLEINRNRTNRAIGLDLLYRHAPEPEVTAMGMPLVPPATAIPTQLIGFNEVLTFKGDKSKTAVHFYLDDYQFERVWKKPDKYLDELIEFQAILSPDFSLYRDMPYPMQIWNSFRGKLIAQYYSDYMEVIPTISWSDLESVDFSLNGIPRGSVVSIATTGIVKDMEGRANWNKGVTKMIDELAPAALLIYGHKMDRDYGVPVYWYENNAVARLNNAKSIK